MKGACGEADRSCAGWLGLRSAKADEPRTLDICFLDMVGGASTLIVTPLGESVLIDMAWLRRRRTL